MSSKPPCLKNICLRVASVSKVNIHLVMKYRNIKIYEQVSEFEVSLISNELQFKTKLEAMDQDKA